MTTAWSPGPAGPGLCDAERVTERDPVESMVSLPLFPFEGDLRIKPLGPLLDTELPREGEHGRPCQRCDDPLGDVVWHNDRWLVSRMRPSACPVGLFLETRAHLDLDAFDEALAAELGMLTWRLEAAIASLPEVGRVHIHRWADGSAHFHQWFLARPARRLEQYGWGNELWSQLLPPLPEDILDRHRAHVLTTFRDAVGGDLV